VLRYEEKMREGGRESNSQSERERNVMVFCKPKKFPIWKE